MCGWIDKETDSQRDTSKLINVWPCFRSHLK